MIQPVERPESPLDVEGVNLKLTADEIVGMVREIGTVGTSRNRPSVIAASGQGVRLLCTMPALRMEMRFWNASYQGSRAQPYSSLSFLD